MTFKKPKLKSIISGFAIAFLIMAPLLTAPNTAKAAGKEFYPSSVNMSLKSDKGLLKVTKEEVNNGTEATAKITLKLDGLKDLNNATADIMAFSGDANADTWYSTTSHTSNGGYLDNIKALVVYDINKQCHYLVQWGSWDNCDFTAGSADVPKVGTTWKVTETREASLAIKYNLIKPIKDSAADTAVTDTKTFEIFVFPHFELAYNNDFTLTTSASPLSTPLKIKVMVFKDAATRDADTTTDTGGSGDSTGQGAATAAATLGNVINEALTWYILANTRIVYWAFANVIAPLIESLLKIHPYQDIFVEAIFLGWQLIRNLCNIFFIVILLVIGMGTLFRVESYNYKHLLVKVVIAALLVNFSLVFGQAILGIADTVQQQFLPDSTNVIRALGSKLMVEPINKLTEGIDATTGGAAFAGLAKPIFAFALALGAFFTFCAIAAFLVIRIVALWILLLISPLAYVANILPQTASYSKDWWQKFLKYAFMTPVLAFFLNLAAVFVTTTISQDKISQFLVIQNNSNNEIGQFVYLAGSQILTIMFILVGIKAAASSGTYGAAAVTNFAEKGIQKPFEWYGKGARAGAERGFEGIQNKAGITLDPRLLKKAGSEYFDEQKGKRLQARKTAGFMSGVPWVGKKIAGTRFDAKLGDAKSNFEAYANWRGVKRAVWDSKLGAMGATYNANKAHAEEHKAHLLSEDAKPGEVSELDQKKAEQKTLAKQQINNKQSVVDAQNKVSAMEKQILAMESKQAHPNDPSFDQNLQVKIEAKKQELENFKGTTLEKAQKQQAESQAQFAKVTKELKEDKEFKDKNGLTGFTMADKEKAKERQLQYEKMVSKTKRPEGYAAIAAHHHLLSDEEKKISHIDDSDRLIQLYKDAEAQGDRYKAEAILHKLAKDTNFNEIAYEITGRPENGGKREMSFDASKKVFESFAKTFGVDKHGMLEVASEIGYINEGVHMFNGARLTNIDQHGHMKWADKEKDHMAAINGQMNKIEPQGQARTLWRGSYVDESEEGGKRTYKLHKAGINILRDSLSKGDGLKGVAGRMQEYNRKAVYSAIIGDKTGDPEIANLKKNRKFMYALKYGEIKDSADPQGEF